MEKQNLTVRKLPDPPEAPEEPDMNAVYIKAYEGKVDDLIKLLAKVAGSKDGAKIIKRLPGFDGKNDIKDLQKNFESELEMIDQEIKILVIDHLASEGCCFQLITTKIDWIRIRI